MEKEEALSMFSPARYVGKDHDEGVSDPPPIQGAPRPALGPLPTGTGEGPPGGLPELPAVSSDTAEAAPPWGSAVLTSSASLNSASAPRL